MTGYVGKILRLDLTERRVTEIDTEPYRSWGGGHGLGAALFWDFCKDKTITDGRHSANVCCVVTSPLCGTIVPSAGGRCEVVGVGVGQYPVSWFTRTNFGGRFSTMLKYAGWDGIVIEGKADSPVWVDIRDGQVIFHAAQNLWGKDTWETEKLLKNRLGSEKLKILAIGPAGEKECRFGCIITDRHHAAGRTGMGSVMGSKNLKAIAALQK